MGKYAISAEKPESTVKTRGSHLRVHYKNTRETVRAIKNMPLRRAQRYLANVIKKKEIVPFTKYTGCIGRKAQVIYVLLYF